MDVILLTDVDKLGTRGVVVGVARGYARNFLLPRKMAEVATPAKLKELERREAQRARHDASNSDQARDIAARLEQLELRFDVNAGPTGSLFGSVTPSDIADRIWDEAKIRVDRRRIQLSESIKRIGRYQIEIGIFDDVTATVRTLVVPEGGELPPEEPEAPAEAEAPAEEPVAEAAVEEPAAEAAIEEPVAEAVAEEPVAEEPVAEEPVAEAAVETAPPGMPEAEPADAVVEEAAAGTIGQTGEPESA
jgi:large subunit ribosomal protein L9